MVHFLTRKQNPQFLLTSYLLWIPEILHKPLKQYWPPVVFKGDKVVTNPELLKTLTKIIAENSKNRE